MIKWLVIGLVLWYFYKRFTKKNRSGYQNDPRYIRQDDFQSGTDNNVKHPVDEDDYIDYEEVK